VSYFHLVLLLALGSFAALMGGLAWRTIRHPQGPQGSKGYREHTDFQVGVIAFTGLMFVFAGAGALDLAGL
jgi:hypothetical protein